MVRRPREPFVYNNDPGEDEADVQRAGVEHAVGRRSFDEEGYLYLTDRKLFMIISGGVNIYPQEIEDVLMLHPTVADVAVFGVPDPEMGEEVKAVIQPTPGVTPGPELAEEIMAFCRGISRTTSARGRSSSPRRSRLAERQALQNSSATPTGPIPLRAPPPEQGIADVGVESTGGARRRLRRAGRR